MLAKTLFFILAWCLLLPLTAQKTSQLLSAESYHALPNGPEKIEAVRNLERDGWMTVDTFINLDQTTGYLVTDLAPYIDDNGNTVFLVADISPAFPGAKDALRKILADSLGAIVSGPDDEVQNTLYFSFVVEADGSISELKEAQEHPEWIAPVTINKVLNALHAMPRWSPGTWKGKTVRVKMLVTVNLKE